MNAKFLVRFDDICPTMNWQTWERIEAILNGQSIIPILAVVPENRDKTLERFEPLPGFWDRVRDWQAKGWSIALHGCNHDYVTDKSGMIGLNTRSEFAGLSYEAQRKKLEHGLAIFQREGICPDAWIAPAHSFDHITVNILKELGIGVISDGYFFRPVRYLGCIWIPQQIWRFDPMPFGLWTVCFHHNNFGEALLVQFEKNIRSYRSQIVSLSAVLSYPVPQVTIIDHLFSIAWRWLLLTLRMIR